MLQCDAIFVALGINIADILFKRNTSTARTANGRCLRKEISSTLDFTFRRSPMACPLVRSDGCCDFFLNVIWYAKTYRSVNDLNYVKKVMQVLWEHFNKSISELEQRILMCMDEGHHLRSYLKEIMKLGNLQDVLE